MRTPPGSRDARTGRVSGFSDGPKRLMPKCSATTVLAKPAGQRKCEASQPATATAAALANALGWQWRALVW